jgi:hypothetical protein
MVSNEIKISRGLKKLLNKKENRHSYIFPPVYFDQEKRNSYIDSFTQALVVEIASAEK